MLSFISFAEVPEQIEIVADNQGIEDLIDYLKSIQRERDHMHLTIGTELDDYPIVIRKDITPTVVKSVLLDFKERLK